MANDRLKAVVKDIETKKAERAMTSLMLDWQRFYIALGEGLLAIGIWIVILLYWMKKDASKSDTDLT